LVSLEMFGNIFVNKVFYGVPKLAIIRLFQKILQIRKASNFPGFFRFLKTEN